MQWLDRCVVCGHDELVAVDLPLKTSADHLAEFQSLVVVDSAFALCRRCDLVFARRRQSPEEELRYHEAFHEFKLGRYIQYPPVPTYLENSRRVAEQGVSLLDREGLLRSDIKVLHVRCEGGAQLALLRDRYGISQVYGLDYAEPNIRYAREDLGLANVAMLQPVDFSVPFEEKQFDLVCAAHQMTHALEPMRLLARFRELLAPGGALVLYDEPDHIPSFRDGTDHARRIIRFHKQLLVQSSVDNMCRLAGFDARLIDYATESVRWARNANSMTLLLRPNQPTRPDELRPEQGDEILAALRRGRRMRPVFQVKRRGRKLLRGANRDARRLLAKVMRADPPS